MGRLLALVGVLGILAVLCVSAAPAAPGNSAAPSISGSFQVGQTLTATSGDWSGSSPTYSFDWQRCLTVNGAVVADSPAGYWRLGDSAGTASATDSSGHNHNGDVHGSVTFRQSGSLTGDSSTAASFDGSTGFIGVGSQPIFQPSSAFTLEAWVKSSSSGTIIAKPFVIGASPQESYALALASGKAVATVDTTAGHFAVTSSATAGDGNWHMVDATLDGSTLIVYVDGAASGSVAVSGSLQYAGSKLQIGRQDSNGGYLNGTLEEVSLFGSALNASAIGVHYTAAHDANDGGTGTTSTCSSIGAADSSAYTLVSADNGSRVRVEVTATDPSGSAAADSTATAVTGGAPVNVSAPSVSGTTAVNQTLTADTGTWSGEGSISYGYQWLECGYPQVVNRESPSEYWRLGEAQGTTTLANEVSGGLALTLSGSASQAQTSAVGDANTSTQFTGGDGSVTESGSAGLDPTSQMTLEWWYKGGVPASANWILAKDSSSNADPYLQYGVGADGSNNVKVAVATGSTLTADTWSTGVPWPSDSSWHYFAVTVDASVHTATLYIDGQQKAQKTSLGGGTTINTYPGTAFHLLHSQYKGSTTAGSLDEVAIYGSALTAPQVRDHYDAATGISSACTNVSGATSSTYTTTTADQGQELEVKVTASNSYGSTSVTSAPTARIGVNGPTNTALPTVSGSTLVGQTLTASNGTWTSLDPNPTTYSYQWQRCGYAGAVMSDAPSGYWRLDGVGGSDQNLAGGSNAILSGAYSSIAGSTADGDNATQFSGGDASVANYAALNSTGDMSIEWWYEGSSRPAGSDWLLAKTNSTGLQFGVGAAGSGNVKIGLGIGTSLTADTWKSSLSWPVDSQWHYYAATFASATKTIKLYEDGTLVQTATLAAGTIATSSNAVNFMHATGIGNAEQGALDEVAIYPSELSATSVSNHFAAAKSTTPFCLDIPGTTSSSYSPMSADVGTKLRVTVTAQDAFGSTSASSEQTGAVSDGSPVNSTPPSINGAATEGQTLTATAGTWSGSGTITSTFQWQSCQSYATTVMSHNPIGYWRLGESSATLSATDLSYTGNGTYDHVTAGQSGALIGDADTAAQFSSSSNSILNLPHSQLPTGLGAATIEAWVRTGTQDNMGIAGWGDGNASNDDNFFLYVDKPGSGSGDVVQIRSGQEVFAGATIDGNWHMLDAVDTANGNGPGNIWIIYVDGVKVATSSARLSGYSKKNTTAYIGAGFGDYFNGAIDEVSFYNNKLSSGQISADYTAGKAGVSCSDITGATAATYIVSSSDVGTQLRVVVTATNSQGSAAATATPTIPVGAAAPSLDSPNADGGAGTVTPTLSVVADTTSGHTTPNYVFQLASDKDFSNIISTSALSTTTTWQVPSSAKLQDSASYWWRVRETYGSPTVLTGWTAGRKFTVHVNYFGSQGFWPMWSHGPITVNEATGNVVLTPPTPAVPTANNALSLALTYNSDDTRSGFDNGLGIGWTIAGSDGSASAPARLIDHSVLSGSAAMDAAEVVWPGGSSTYYSHVGSSPEYDAPQGDLSHLTVNGTGSSQLWTLTIPDSGAVYTFGPANATTGVAQLTQGELIVAKKSTSTLTLTYSSGYMTSLYDSSDTSRKLNLYWHAIDSTHCGSAILCVSGPDGIKWTYRGPSATPTAAPLTTINDGTRNVYQLGYTGGCPTSVKNANDLAGIGAAGHAVAVTYPGGAICSATNGTKPNVMTVSDGPITGQTPGTSTWSFAYTASTPASPISTDPAKADHADTPIGTARPAAGKTQITPPDQQSGGPVTTVYWDTLNHPIEVVDRLGRITQAGFNGLDEQLWSEDDDGNPTDWSWDPVLNVLNSVTGPDPDGAGPATRPVTQYRFDENTVGDASTAGAPTQGLQAFYYNGINFSDPSNNSGRARVAETDSSVDYSWADGPANIGNPNNFSVLWRGDLLVSQEGDYTFSTVAYAGQNVSLSVDGMLPIYNWGSSSTATYTAQPVHLTVGLHSITLAYGVPQTPAQIHLRWACSACDDPISTQVIPQSALRPAWLNQTTAVSPGGRVGFTHYAQRALGLPDYTLDPVNGQNLITSFTYDSYGRLVSKVMPNGNAGRTIDSDGDLQGAASSAFETDYSYYAAAATATPPGTCGGISVDQGGALQSSSPHGLATTTYVYDVMGRPLARTNGSGTTCFHYDSGGEGRLLNEIAPGDSQATTFTYDPNGSQLTATDTSGTVSSGYDEMGRAVSTTDATGASATFSYDADGNRLTRVATPFAGGSSYTTNYGYDAGDELTSETDSAGQQYGFFYDSRGNLRGTQYPNGTFSWVERDPLGETVALDNRHGTINATTDSSTVPVDASPLADYSYQYNADQQRTQETLSAGGQADQTTQYGYDALGRLAQATLPDGTCRNYSYDLDSNRTQTAESTTGCGGTFSTTASYTYDQAVTPGVDQLTSVTAGGNTSSYGYTADGQVKSYGASNTISWDGWQRTSGGSFNGTAVTYHYDPLGGLLSRTSSGGNTTGYLLGDLFETSGSGTITTSYIDGSTGDLAEYAGPPDVGSTVDYLYYNGHDDLAAEADGSGNRTALHTYDPFGAPLDTQPADTTKHLFTGAWAKQYDTASDLILMGARPYDPALGRFLAVDPIDGGSLNNYDYAGQDPINGYDLDGLSIVEEGMSSGGVISGSNSPLSCINELAWGYQWRCEGESSGPSSHPSAKSVWKEVKTLAVACGFGAFTSGLVASETGAGAVGAAAVGCVTNAVIEAVKQVNRPAGDVLEIIDVARNVREIVDTKDGIVFEVRISHAHGRTTTTISQSRGR